VPSPGSRARPGRERGLTARQDQLSGTPADREPGRTEQPVAATFDISLPAFRSPELKSHSR
jgi:hypothetical protein